MKVCFKLALSASLLLGGVLSVTAQTGQATAKFTPNRTSSNNFGKNDANGKPEATPSPTPVAATNEPTAATDPLLNLLVSKGVLSQSDAAAVGIGTLSEQRDKLTALLVQKGLISADELNAVRGGSAVIVPAVATKTLDTAGVAAARPSKSTANSAQTKPPAVIPAIAPLRVLQLEGAKRDGLIPDIKLGSGAKLKLYGFFKASALFDSSNPPGNDFPLPGFLNDSGPSTAGDFHLKARALRVGANFEWLDPSPKTTVTGKLEFDFEGDFPRVANRNIGSIRASQPSLRLAWMRLDRTFNDKVSGHILFGQDWTPFASSTLPNTIETTGLHLGYGNIYERLPQIRTGVNFLLSKNRNVRFQPEFAIALPAFGNLPTNVADQLAFAERQGVDSRRPELQGRFVLQFQLDKAAGVAPAQLIGSWVQAKRRAIVTRAALDTATVGNVNRAAILAAFPSGVEATSDRYGYTAEFQLPTRYVTIIGKYYNGSDLRFYFGGQLFSEYNDTFGLTGTAGALSTDGSSTVVLGVDGSGRPTIAPQRAVRGQGGFIEVGLPLSRIFGVDPASRAAGFTANLHYGYDEAKARDVRRFLGNTLNPIGAGVSSFGANRGRSDAAFGNIQYKLNSFITFALEETYFRTRAANQTGALPLFRGIPSRETQNVRTEFATIFNF